MTQPAVSDIHVDAALTQISIAFIQEQSNFVADQVFPNIPVAKRSDRYYTYDRGFFNRDEMDVRSPNTESKGTGYEVDNTPTYYTPVYALHHNIADQVRENADSVLQLNREATLLLTHKALIKREVLWASKYFAGGIWTGGDDDGVAAAPGANQFLQWNDAASTPIEDIRAAKTTVHEGTGFMPNTLVLQQRVLDALVDHPDLVDRIKAGQTPNGPAVNSLNSLATIFVVDRVLVMRAIRNTAKEGATNAHSFIGGKAALLTYAAPTPSLMAPSGGYTFSWSGFSGAGAAGSRIKNFRMESLASDRIEIEMAFDQKLIASELGYFFDSAVA